MNTMGKNDGSFLEGCSIREMRPDEYPLLEKFLYDAIFQEEGEEPLPISIVQDPSIAVYMEHFGQPGDICVVAEYERSIVGAVWTRVWAGSRKGYGYIDDHTPELSISIDKHFRNDGIGSSLLQAILTLLSSKGYGQVSLSVQRRNRASELYRKVGFQVLGEHDEDLLMVFRL